MRDMCASFCRRCGLCFRGCCHLPGCHGHDLLSAPPNRRIVTCYIGEGGVAAGPVGVHVVYRRPLCHGCVIQKHNNYGTAEVESVLSLPKKTTASTIPRRDKKNARPLLEEEKAMGFHPTVSQLLFMATRVRREYKRRWYFSPRE
jgi:hypothetical protein